MSSEPQVMHDYISESLVTVPRLMTQGEVAKALRVTTRTVRQWTADGVLPSIKIGGVRRYRASDVASLIYGAS